jgi:hypothetical protein
LGSRKHTPSLNTLKRYAEACGKRLVISMIWLAYLWLQDASQVIHFQSIYLFSQPAG